MREGQDIHVLYGFELMEVVPNDREHMAFKMMVGRLYNAQVKVATLEEVFDVDRKTMSSWGKAIRSRDANELQRVMLGRGASQKRTPVIDRYIVRRWGELRSEGCPNYRAALALEVEAIFEIKLCGETIRKILNESKSGAVAGAGNEGAPFENEEATCSKAEKTTSNDLKRPR